MFVQLNEENRIIGTADENCFPEDTIVIEFNFPEDFDFDNQYEFEIVDGKLVASESEDAKRYSEETEQLEKREEFLSTAPDTLSDQDDAVCALYEENLAIKKTAAEQDDAICYLYEQLLKEGETNGK